MGAVPISPASQVLRPAEASEPGRPGRDLGPLGPATGFLPPHPPLRQFEPSHRAWDDAVRDLPGLYWSLDLRRALDRMPVLPADRRHLPERFLPRAATVLGTLGHAYVHLHEGPPAPRLPDSIAVPWREVRQRLGRRSDPVLTYQDLIVNNWQTDAAGSPAQLRVENTRLLVSTTGTREEHVFYLVQLEILARTARLVGDIAVAQDAAVQKDPDRLLQALTGLREALVVVNRVSLPLIDPRPSRPTYVDPVVWAKAVAPLAVPLAPGVLGPSGTASPLMNLLDAFFARPANESQLGQEIRAHRGDYPARWRDFLTAVDAVSVSALIPRAAGGGLQQAYDEAFDAYAGEDGFLGRHRRKVYGYLTAAFKVGRGVTIGGFRGSPQDREWDHVDTALQQSQRERGNIRPARDERYRASQGGQWLTGGAGETRAIPVSELARHNDPDQGWWVSVDGTVYDLSDFVAAHPGGPVVIGVHAGLDATAAFARAHRPGSRSATALRRRYAIGYLEQPDVDAAAGLCNAWVTALFHVVELQNILRLDASFRVAKVSPTNGEERSSALQVDRARNLYQRFSGDYLPQIAHLLETLMEATRRSAASGTRDAASSSTVRAARQATVARAPVAAARATPPAAPEAVEAWLSTTKRHLTCAVACFEDHGDSAPLTESFASTMQQIALHLAFP